MRPVNHLKSISVICLICVGLLAVTTPIIGAVSAAPKTGQVAVFYDPRVSQADILGSLQSSDMRLVRFGGLPGSAIIEMSTPDQRSLLKKAGALIFADPIVLGGCTASQTLGMTS